MKKLFIIVLVICGIITNSFAQKNRHYKTITATKNGTVPATPARPAIPGVSPAVPATPASPARKQTIRYGHTKGHAYGHSKRK